MVRRAVTSILLGCAAVALAVACASSGGTQRPVAGSDGNGHVADDAVVQAALTRSCYGCHAQSGTLPWQAKLAPSAWFLGSARQKLDFSAWQSLDADHRGAALRSIEHVVGTGEMPPWDSALLDGAEKLSPAEKERVVTWASEAARDATR